MEKQKLKDIIDDVLSDDNRIGAFYLEHTENKSKLHVNITDEKFTRVNFINLLEEFGIFTKDVEIILCNTVDIIIDVYKRCNPMIIVPVVLIEEPKPEQVKKQRNKKQ